MITRLLNTLTIRENKPTTHFLLQCYKALKKRSSFIIFVLIPWTLTSIYLTLIKTPIYESSASILIHHYTTYSPLNRLTSMLSKHKHQIKEPHSVPLFLIQNYIYSGRMVSEIQNSIDMKHHYQSKQVDILSRLKNNPNQKEFLDYYMKKVKVSLDATTGELSISVDAFSPLIAQALLTIIIDNATQFLKRINTESGLEQSKLMQNNLDSSRQKYINAEMSLHKLIKNNSKNNATNNITLEEKKLNLKFAKIEYESYQQAYVLWSLSLKKNTPVQTTTPTLPDYYTYPKIPYDLISVFIVLTILFILWKMVLLVIHEHID